jgi:protein FRG1
MVKPLTFKGDKKPPKKRKRAADPTIDDPETKPSPASLAIAPTAAPAASTEAPADDAWVTADAPSDLSGPLLLVLPTTPPTALAADAAGAVFALPIENMLDADPATAEPHDVRMVWVARRATLAAPSAPSAPAPTSSASDLSGAAAAAAAVAAGMDGATVVAVGTGAAGSASDEMALRAHHGRFLAVDAAGALSATREAVGVEETFRCVPAPAGAGGMALMTARDLFIGVDEEGGEGKKARRRGGEDEGGTSVRVRGDVDAVEFRSTLRMRMQARFKPRLRGAREERERAKVSWKELEGMVGRRLGEEEVRVLKRARRKGNFHEVLLDVKIKGKHDKFA